ncbi:MAG: NUDIX pyrophosphatase [Clostridia bacterium]|nr:NUDIX pyrophosphatase [Clostridia bacterium]
MREPYQILSIPYRIVDGTPLFCAFRRTDSSYWQFIAGGGENGETPIEAAKRETIEEIGVEPINIKQLTCIAYVPAEVIAESRRQHWDKNTFVIPEYSFAFECDLEPMLSNEHSEYKWLTYNEARKLLKWDSNKVAMYEIKCILENRE